MFYKFLSANWCHGRVQYKEGLNVDPLPFDPSGECMPGGLYFTDFKHLARWYNPGYVWIADVTLPDGAQVYAEPCGTKWKADCIELSNLRPLSEFFAALDEDTVCGLLAQNGWMLARVKTQTHKACLAAVRHAGWALCFVADQTNDICLAAVQQDGWALQFVNEQTEEICRAAMAQDPDSRFYVKLKL